MTPRGFPAAIGPGVRKKSKRTKRRGKTDFGCIHNCCKTLSEEETVALWSSMTKDPDVNTWPLARPFAHSLALLTYSLAPHCSLYLCPRSVHLFAHSSEWLNSYFLCFFFCPGAQCLECWGKKKGKRKENKFRCKKKDKKRALSCSSNATITY